MKNVIKIKMLDPTLIESKNLYNYITKRHKLYVEKES